MLAIVRVVLVSGGNSSDTSSNSRQCYLLQIGSYRKSSNSGSNSSSNSNGSNIGDGGGTSTSGRKSSNSGGSDRGLVLGIAAIAVAIVIVLTGLITAVLVAVLATVATVVIVTLSLHTQCLSCVLLFGTLMDGSPPGSPVHGISQARILEWVAMPFSRGSSQPRD